MGEIQPELEKRLGERTLVLCKPEAVLLGDYPKILQRIHDLKLATPLIKMFSFTDASILDFYQEVVEKRTASGTPREEVESSYKLIAGKPTLAVVVQGINSIPAIRKLAGGIVYIDNGEVKHKTTFEPRNAPEGTIRGDLSTEDITIANLLGQPVQNYIHASDSRKSYDKEVAILEKHGHISKQDFINYDHPAWQVLGYRRNK